MDHCAFQRDARGRHTSGFIRSRFGETDDGIDQLLAVYSALPRRPLRPLFFCL